ncbi:acyl-CoA dehydrogenase [Alterisphingorhabdus coralli]|uniref:3-methylmercaptopropionyl-CoA dehydrogenase n=1 Tax=Alterisphingorhabdus coralli TaxID=3071408 RepID=A0AA97F5U2_9SPHN|nr:acyl-CoA dehydrogenase [Parasphingorhabdus sp. SCSIO 66989]WOE74874.1 acyl-CoA dehydrogenase [Parasphingorhabdus sp. SCSIO 66989]
MTFTAPTKDQLFALETATNIAELANHDRFAEADADLVQAIVEGVGQFAEGEFAPLNRVGDEVGAKLVDGRVVMPEGFKQAYKGYVEAGWNSLCATPDHGGQGLPFALATVSLDSLGAANMAFTLCPMLSVGAIEALEHHGSEEQKERYLPKLISGEWPGTMNLTEPQAGSDVGALRTTATPLGDGKYQIKGQKIYITFGDHDMADNIIHLVLARTPDAPPGTKGISLFLVPKYQLNDDGTPGKEQDIETVSIEHKLGIHASPTCVLQYGERGECIGELIGGEFGGIRAMFTMMNNARLNVGLQGVEIAERATQQALYYAQERVQSARAGGDSRDPVAIVEHPDVRRMLLRMKAGTEAARALLYFAAGQVDRATLGMDGAQEKVDILTPLAKGYGTDLGIEIASLGVQIHGGMGFVEETGAAQHYRDARIMPIYEGTNGIQAADLVGRKLAMRGGEAMKEFLDELRDIAGNEAHVAELVAACQEVTNWMLGASVDERLAGSYAFMTMMAVATSGALMAKQHRVAQERLDAGEGDSAFLKAKLVTTRYYCDHMVPEALGLKASAMGGADLLYALSAEELAA